MITDRERLKKAFPGPKCSNCGSMKTVEITDYEDAMAGKLIVYICNNCSYHCSYHGEYARLHCKKLCASERC